MMEYLDSIIGLMLLFAVGLISPGPDFAIIVRNSLSYSRKTAICTALGISLGAATHSAYILFGLGELITKSPIALHALTIIGGTYLIYLGFLGVKSKAKPRLYNFKNKDDIKASAAITSGYMTCLLNPKAIFFLTSVLTSVSELHAPIALLFLFGLTIFLETMLWYTFVAVFFTAESVRGKVGAIEHWINRITGGILMLFGGGLLLESVAHLR